MDIYTHKHHILPKHAGGDDSPENLIELTIEDHAIAHRVLYSLYGRQQDYLAWQGLSGRMNKEQIIRELLSRPSSESKKKKISKALKGKPKSELTKQRMRKPKKWTAEGKKKLSECAKLRKPNLGKTWSEETKQKMSKSSKNRIKLECPHCFIIMDASNAKKYHFERCKHK